MQWIEFLMQFSGPSGCIPQHSPAVCLNVSSSQLRETKLILQGFVEVILRAGGKDGTYCLPVFDMKHAFHHSRFVIRLGQHLVSVDGNGLLLGNSLNERWESEQEPWSKLCTSCLQIFCWLIWKNSQLTSWQLTNNNFTDFTDFTHQSEGSGFSSAVQLLSWHLSVGSNESNSI